MDTFFGNFEGDSPMLQLVGQWSYKVYAERELLQMNCHLLISALLPIYIGAHASLRRPPSAQEPKKSKGENAEDDDEIEVDAPIEGLSPSDAILFPLLAGVVLTGLYFLIKWIQNPELLNKILNYYFSLIGVVGVGKLAADSLDVATGFVFPSVWSSRGKTYVVDPLLSQQLIGKVKTAKTQVHREFTDKNNPFPGPLSSITFPKRTTQQIWAARSLLKSHWIFRGYLHGVFSAKSHIKMNDILGFLIGIITVALYNTNGKAWWLLNIIGTGFCYGTLQLMSPTTFWTGSMVLAGLFVYDIVMVFYTPMMITVATTIDAPIKLVFPGPGRGSMLGLGDVVLPGIMMALALRFDLYLHYIRQSHPTLSHNNEASLARAPYVEATGLWGERFWTWGAKKDETTVADGARFKKVYFKASMIGYVIGLITTLFVLNIFKHGQPALFYLVPSVLGSLWGTALVRGDISSMWTYTEDGSLEEGYDEKMAAIEKHLKKSSEPTKGSDSTDDSNDRRSLESSSTSAEGLLKPPKKAEEQAKHLFLFSLTAPKSRSAALLSNKT